MLCQQQLEVALVIELGRHAGEKCFLSFPSSPKVLLVYSWDTMEMAT